MWVAVAMQGHGYHWRNTLIRSDLPKSVHRCNVRNLDGHLRLEKEDR
jgi:hypothetical protein